jgi:hypothetical protein
MTKTQSIVQSIGLSNLITIGVLVVGLTGTFVGLSTKVDAIATKLQDEVVERKVEDEKLRMEITKNWDANSKDHASIEQALNTGFATVQENIQKLDATMSYHTGYHSGKGQ